MDAKQNQHDTYDLTDMLKEQEDKYGEIEELEEVVALSSGGGTDNSGSGSGGSNRS
jgi:hypothetical protein